MLLISLLVLPSYFIIKNTRKEVRGKDFIRAPATGVFSESFVTTPIINAEMRTFTVKYILFTMVTISIQVEQTVSMTRCPHSY